MLDPIQELCPPSRAESAEASSVAQDGSPLQKDAQQPDLAAKRRGTCSERGLDPSFDVQPAIGVQLGRGGHDGDRERPEGAAYRREYRV